MYIKRTLETDLKNSAKTSPVIAVLGPRQTGKSTLVKKTFPKHTYISLENFKERDIAKQDPLAFLEKYNNSNGLILDEIQQVPELFSYIQGIVDANYRPGYFVLTGSQNILLMKSISQTLAGRISIHTLLPFSIHELSLAGLLPDNYNDLFFKGFYPPLYDTKRNEIPRKWYENYIQTYVERDVRDLLNIGNLNTFRRFIGLCAGRIGQILNLSSLADDCGISHSTAKAWVSVLETSYIIFLLQPHHRNFNKRLIKSPKLFFYDPGLACSILKVKDAQQVYDHYLRGGLFETMILSEIQKNFYNAGHMPSIYFWCDRKGEVDCIIDQGTTLYPIEIKAGKTFSINMFKMIDYWNNLAEADSKDSYLIYGGNENWSLKKGNVLPWNQTYSIAKKILKQ